MERNFLLLSICMVRFIIYDLLFLLKWPLCSTAFAGDSVIFIQESVCEVFRFKFSKRTLDLWFSSFLVYTKGRVEKYNYREITPHFKSTLFSYQVKHVKTISIKKCKHHSCVLKVKAQFFHTLLYVQRSAFTHHAV